MGTCSNDSENAIDEQEDEAMDDRYILQVNAPLPCDSMRIDHFGNLLSTCTQHGTKLRPKLA